MAKHPSENEQRLMVRLLAFALFAGPDLRFGKGLSSDDEAALAEVDPTGRVVRWIEVGQPDESRLRKAAGKADQVVVLAFGGRAVDMWWQQSEASLARFANLQVLRIGAEEAAALGALAERNMKAACTLQDGLAWFSVGEQSIEIRPQRLRGLDD